MTHSDQTFHIEPDRHFLKSHSPAAATVAMVRWTIVVFILVAAIGSGSVYFQIQQRSGSATYVRIAARQQILAQQLTTNGLRFHHLPADSSDRASILTEVSRIVSEFVAAQNGLVSGSPSLGLSAPEDQIEKDLLSATGSSFVRTQRLAERLASGRFEDEDLNELVDANESYQSGMGALVERLEKNSESAVRKLAQSIYISTGGFLAIALAAWLLVLRPRANRLLRLYNELQTFRMAIDYAAEHMVITDPDGKVLYANSAAERITGFSRKEMIGRKVGGPDLWGGLMGAEFYEKLWKKIKRDRQIFTGVLTNRRKNGERYTAEATISPVLDAHGKVLYFLGIERDLTHHAQKR